MRMLHPTFLALACGLALSACGGGGSNATPGSTTGTTTDTPYVLPKDATPKSLTNGKFYANPYSKTAQWLRNHPDDPRVNVLQSAVASKSSGIWMVQVPVGQIAGEVESFVTPAADRGEVPVLVTYNVPYLAAGTTKMTGAKDYDDYTYWIEGFIAGLKGWDTPPVKRARPAIVIVEPDALMQLEYLPDHAARKDRLKALDYAAGRINHDLGQIVYAYIDAGNPGWMTPLQVATLLKDAGVERAHGFSLNVANYFTTEQTVAYGKAINVELKKLSGFTRPFAIDTSQNGNGPATDPSLDKPWCDPHGRRLGQEATWVNAPAGEPEVLLWVKPPGEVADCTKSESGFEPDLAYALATNPAN